MPDVLVMQTGDRLGGYHPEHAVAEPVNFEEVLPPDPTSWHTWGDMPGNWLSAPGQPTRRRRDTLSNTLRSV